MRTIDIYDVVCAPPSEQFWKPPIGLGIAMTFISDIHIDSFEVMLVHSQYLVMLGYVDNVCIEFAAILKHY